MKPTLEDLQRWWILSLDPTGEAPFESVTDYAYRKLPTAVFADESLESLGMKLRTCPARSPSQLRQWCYRQIDRLAAKISRSEKAERRGVKQFEYEVHGARCFITLHDAGGEPLVWKIPADWLEDAKKLWPLHIRRYENGKPYVSRKVSVIHPDGTRSQKDIAVHRLFAGVSAEDAKVDARDGDWLNYLGGNIRKGKSTVSLDRCVSLDSVPEQPDRPLPAKSKSTPVKLGFTTKKPYLNKHERDVWAYLHGLEVW